MSIFSTIVSVAIVIIVYKWIKYGCTGSNFGSRIRDQIGEIKFQNKPIGKSKVKVFSLEESEDEIGLEWNVHGESFFIRGTKEEVSELIKSLENFTK